MSFEAKWTISGSSFDDSSQAFIDAVNEVGDGKILKKYEKQLNKNFQEYLRENLRRAGLEDLNLEQSLFLSIVNGKIVYSNTNPIVTERYEYGFVDIDLDDDDLGYYFESAPRYFIRPAIDQSLNEIGNLLLDEANRIYMNRRSLTGDEIS